MNSWIDQLKLLPHPEGGYYRETYRAAGEFFTGRPGETRSFSTAIYFLLEKSDRSRFHRIQSDEIWHYHAGGRLKLFTLTERGVVTQTLGPDIMRGDQLQIVIPARHWFGALVVEGDYVLSSCTVSPGFDFKDFELADRVHLLDLYPEQTEIITRLT